MIERSIPTAFGKFRHRLLITLISLVLLLVGCAAGPVGITLFGIGTATGVSYTLSGYAYKTFTAPLKEVNTATETALERMGIEVASREVSSNKIIIKGKAVERQVEVSLEALTSKATRIRTVVMENAVLKDRATATEIILQTEQVLIRH